MQSSLRLSLSLTSAAALALANTPIQPVAAQDDGNAADLGVMEINLKDALISEWSTSLRSVLQDITSAIDSRDCCYIGGNQAFDITHLQQRKWPLIATLNYIHKSFLQRSYKPLQAAMRAEELEDGAAILLICHVQKIILISFEITFIWKIWLAYRLSLESLASWSPLHLLGTFILIRDLPPWSSSPWFMHI